MSFYTRDASCISEDFIVEKCYRSRSGILTDFKLIISIVVVYNSIGNTVTNRVTALPGP